MTESELSHLTRHLEHDPKTHRDFYRLSHSTVQLSKVIHNSFAYCSEILGLPPSLRTRLNAAMVIGQGKPLREALCSSDVRIADADVRGSRIRILLRTRTRISFCGLQRTRTRTFAS